MNKICCVCVLCCLWNLGCSAKLQDNNDLIAQTHIAPSFQNLTSESKSIKIDSVKPEEQGAFALRQFNLLIQDEKLQQILNLALEKNLNVLIMSSRIAQAQSQAKISTSNLFPSVNANLNANYIDRRTLSQSTLVRPGTNSVNANLNMNWELDLFGKLNALRQSSKKDYEQAQSNLAFAQISLIAQVGNLYFTLRDNANAIKNAKDALQNLEEILSLNEKRYKLGLIDTSTYSGFVASVNEQKNTLETLTFTYEQNKNALLILLNIPASELDSQIDFFDSAWELSPLASFEAPNIPSEVILSRADIQASIFALHSQLYRQKNAKLARLPSLSLSGSIGEILYSSNGIGSLVFQIATSLSAPLLNRTALKQNYKIQQELSKEAFYTLQNSINTAFGEIENALFDMRSKQRQIENLSLAFEVAKKAYEGDRLRFQKGLLDKGEFLKSENAFLNAQYQLRSIHIGCTLSHITLFKALGGNLALQAVQDENPSKQMEK